MWLLFGWNQAGGTRQQKVAGLGPIFRPRLAPPCARLGGYRGSGGFPIRTRAKWAGEYGCLPFWGDRQWESPESPPIPLRRLKRNVGFGGRAGGLGFRFSILPILFLSRHATHMFHPPPRSTLGIRLVGKSH